VSASNGLPGDRRLGRYEIVAELGKGAMGTVYKANDPLLERTVALKTINVAVSAEEMAEYEARFYQEAKAAGGLNHPNIVTIYDVGKTGTLPYLAMEYLEGSELNAMLRQSKPLAPAHAVEIAAQVADGLAYAHERGVVHRDVKPANIMVVRGGLVKIADFGVARMRSSELGADRDVVGSPRYMSPEQLLRKRAEHRSDIFSLGVVLYEMLTGVPPFTGADLNAIVVQIVNAEPPPPGRSVADLPETLDSIVMKALAKAPEDRYQSARELAADLRECRKRMGATTRLADLALPASRKAERSPDESVRSSPEGSAVPEEQRLEPADDEHASTLGLSRDFDSLSATARLAAETGVLGAFASFIGASGAPNALPAREGSAASGGTPNALPAAAAPAASAAVSTPPAPQRDIEQTDLKAVWSSTDRVVFGASVAVALVIAVAIVVV
jgi:serine/threonine-protein kinase